MPRKIPLDSFPWSVAQGNLFALRLKSGFDQDDAATEKLKVRHC
jgi:hypothetical protein